jgi:hypothetical protein
MTRALYIIANDAVRARVLGIVASAPAGTRVELKEPKRTLPQNALMWSCLTDIAAQAEHCGRRYSADDWKVIMVHALGKETRFVPSLDGNGFIPIGQSSSDLSKAEMSDLIELMHAFGAERGIVFHSDNSPP